MSLESGDSGQDPGDPMVRVGRRCKAKAKSTGRQCRQLAVDGLDVCSRHGGGSPQAKQALARRNAEIELAEVVDGIDVRRAEPLRDTIVALGVALGQQVEMKDALMDRLAITPEDSPLYPTTAALAADALDRTTKRLLDAVRVGVEGRMNQIEQAEVRLFGDAMKAAADELGLDVSDRNVNETIERMLTQLHEEELIAGPGQPVRNMRHVTKPKPTPGERRGK